jgi:hypothetical protein
MFWAFGVAAILLLAYFISAMACGWGWEKCGKSSSSSNSNSNYSKEIFNSFTSTFSETPSDVQTFLNMNLN